MPSNSAVEAIWQHIARLGYTDEDGRVSLSCHVMGTANERNQLIETVIHDHLLICPSSAKYTLAWFERDTSS